MRTEEELQKAVIELAQFLGWRVAHFRPARTEKGWRTPVQGDGKGFPDLVLARHGRVLFAELKSEKAKLSAEQDLWLYELGPSFSRVWRPSGWKSGEIERELRGQA